MKSLVAAGLACLVASPAFADMTKIVERDAERSLAAEGRNQARPLKLEQVDAVIEENDRAVQACARKLRGDTLAILVRLEIDGEGRVAAAEPSTPNAEGKCLARVAQRLRFPATGTLSHVEYPFMLVPQLRR